MRIGISALNIQTRHDYWHINKLIECFGLFAPDRTFVLIGREGQRDFLLPAPGNFEYRFFKIPCRISDSDNARVSSLVGDVLAELGCDLLFDFGLSGSIDSECPRITFVGSMEPGIPSSNKSNSPLTKRKLRLKKKALINSLNNSQGIIFSSQSLCNETLKITPRTDLKTISAHFGKPDTNECVTRETLSRYGIKKEFLLSPVSSEGIKELKVLLRAYRAAFSPNSGFPDLFLVGSNESPADVCEIIEAIDKNPLESRIKYAPIIPDEEFSALLSEARALVYPFEMFNGVEILIAAMSSSCAIVCVNDKTSREITDGAALYYNPNYWPDLALKLRLIADDDALVDFLRIQSKTKADLFSWEKTAKRILGFFDDIVSDAEKYARAAAAGCNMT